MKSFYIFALFLIVFKLELCSQDKDPKTKKEFLRGKLNQGQVWDHPFTMFNRNRDNSFTWQEDVELIKAEIFKFDKIDEDEILTQTSHAFRMYKSLLQFARTIEPTLCAHDIDECSHPHWVKANAFINMVGLDITISSGGEMEVSEMNAGTKDVFKENAIRGLERMNYKIPPCYGLNDNCKNVRQHAKRLIGYLQSYDMLKTAGALPNDIKCLNNCPRERLREYTSELYQASSRIINSNMGWKKNHGIICANALGMASIVLGHAGGKRDKYDPNKWFQRAHGRKHTAICFDECDDGLEDNFFVGRQVGNNVPTTNSDGTAGFSEGPGYMLDIATSLFPYMRCNDNALNKVNDKNLINDERYIEILKWFYSILDIDGQIPLYDNSQYNYGNIFAILGIKEFKGNPTAIPAEYEGTPNIDLRVDYLLSLGFMDEAKPEPTEDYFNENSGNYIMYDETAKAKFTFHTLFETGIAVDKPGHRFDGTHEDEDFLSFTLHAMDVSANEDKGLNIPLIIDPGFNNGKKFKNYSLQGFYGQHNTFEANSSGNKISIGRATTENGTLEGNLGLGEFRGRKIGMTGDYLFLTDEYFRTILSWHTDDKFYYTVRDETKASTLATQFKINITGNGSAYIKETSDNSSPATFRKENGYHIYSYPCKRYPSDPKNQWRVLHTYLALNNNGNLIEEDPHTYTPAIGAEDTREILTSPPYLTNNSIVPEYYAEAHTQLELISNSTRLELTSIYIPIKCTDELPFHFRSQRAGIAYLTLGFKEQVDTSISARRGISGAAQLVLDTSAHFHLIKETNSLDTIINPFKLNSELGKVLTTNAKSLFINQRSIPYLGKNFGYCLPAYSKIRSIAASKTSLISYQNDTILNSTILVDLSYGISTKNHFGLSYKPLETVDPEDSITILLFGMDRGVDVIGFFNENDTLKGRYDSLSFKYIFHPNEGGPFQINIKPSNPCLDCYFPPNGTDFDTLFIANSKNQHTLGNSKKINANYGNLSILNTTKVNMCAGVILHNKDSLIIEGPAQSMPIRASSCAGIDSIIDGSDNSMLIVSPYSALVLDAGSHTYIKNGAGLYVKQNGSMVIKSGALLEVGDSGKAGWGEVIAEPGAFVYIEDGAQIRYRRVIGQDTADINTINFAIGNGGVISGIYWYIDSVLKAESILPSVTSPIAICSLDSINPIGNPSYGYTNFGRPKATFKTKSLNLCAGYPFQIELKRLLNDAQMRITVCRVDSVWRKNQDGNWHWKDTCINDSIVLDSMPPDPSCLAPRVAPEDWLWYFPVNTTHRVHITVKNECGWTHDTLVEVTVRDTPQINLNVNTTACEGYGTLKAVATINRSGPVHYAFEVTEIPDTATLSYQLGNPSEEYSFDTIGIVPDTFDFPGFYFKGGRKYIVSFTYLNDCGTVTKEQEVEIPTGALITFERPTVYANPVHGARTVQLHGYVNSADSFSWSPATWLNRTDTLVVISTPEDSISYVLTAYQGNCVAYDTAFIKYNRVANAGLEDTVCYTSTKVLLGNSYDLSVFLGYLYYKGGSDFRDNWFLAKTTSDHEYFKYLSMFMQTSTFKSWAQGSSLYTDFTEDLHREQTIRQPWFISYFEQLTAFDNPEMTALDTFVYYINQNNPLETNYTNTGSYPSYAGTLSDFFSYYDDFVANHINTISLSWVKITGADTSFNGSLQESAIAIDEPTRTTTYIQQVITPEYAEIDETIVYVDTIPTVAFAVQLQLDSTVVFENYTEPTDGSSRYSWNFGDGSATSNQVHTYHTFPAFDTLFRVCLTATNDCGSYTWCDTVYIDSAHWGGNMRIWGALRQAQGPEIATEIKMQEKGVEAFVYPNPTEGNTVLVYQIKDDAKLRITDAQGKLVWQTEIKANGQELKANSLPTSVIGPPSSNLLSIPSQTFANGIYFYTLQHTFGSARGKIVVQR